MGELTEEEFKALENSVYDVEEKKEKGEFLLKDIYRNLIDIIKSYVIMEEDYYPILATWIIGTYIHKEFETYPYIYLNAMKGSGKTRLLKLVACLSFQGEVLASMKEAVLFRTNSTLAIDEFESIGRKGSDDLRELLNASYKKGIKVKRMRKSKTPEGEQQVVEEFEVFRPIIIANIWGMENVLSDRCIRLILERSNDKKVTKKVEIFNSDILIQNTTALLKQAFQRESVVRCSVVSPGNIYKEWNNYISNNNTITHTYNNTQQHFFKTLDDSGINGRHLELCLPLILIAEMIGKDEMQELIKILSKIIEEKKEEDVTESRDISVYDFVSQEQESSMFIPIKELTRRFKDFMQDEDPDHPITEKWFGKSLIRLNLIIKSKRKNYGNTVLLDYKKAQDKIKMFK